MGKNPYVLSKMNELALAKSFKSGLCKTSFEEIPRMAEGGFLFASEGMRV